MTLSLGLLPPFPSPGAQMEPGAQNPFPERPIQAPLLHTTLRVSIGLHYNATLTEPNQWVEDGAQMRFPQQAFQISFVETSLLGPSAGLEVSQGVFSKDAATMLPPLLGPMLPKPSFERFFMA